MNSSSVPAHHLAGAVARAVAEAKAVDVLAPVVVWSPTWLAARSFTRAVARSGGAINIRFLTGRQLATELAGLDSTKRLTTAMKRELVRAVLRDTPTRHVKGRSTLVVKEVVRAFDELRSMSVIEREGVLDSGEIAVELVQLYENYRQLAHDYHDDFDVYERAADRVTADGEHVVAAGIDRPSPAESNLVDRLARVGRVTEITTVGSSPSDVDLERITVAPDPAIEVQLVTARLLEAAASGDRFSRMAILHPPASQYGELLRRVLERAGIPWRGHAAVSSLDSVVGAMTVALLDSYLDDSRRAFFSFLDSAPLRVVAGDATTVPVPQWKQVVREMRESGGPRSIATRAHRFGHVGLAGFVDEMVAEAPSPRSWTAWAAWIRSRITRYLGGPDAMQQWPERARTEALRASRKIDELAILDQLPRSDMLVDVETFRGAVVEVLSSRTPTTGRPESVYIGRWSDAVGAEFDTVFVCGLGEGMLDKADTGLVRAVRPPLIDSAGDEARTAVLSVLASSRSAHVSFARADTVARRERRPDPVVLQLASARSNALVGASQLSNGSLDFVSVVPSFSALLTESYLPDAGLERLASATGVEEAVRSRFEMIEERDSVRFTRFDGKTKPVELGTLSPTSLEHWATCPFRYFLRNVLRVDSVDDEEDPWRIAARDRGLLMHRILELFIEQVAVEPVTGAWTQDHRATLHEIADAELEKVREGGRAPGGLLAESEAETLHGNLDRWLATDSTVRRERGTAVSASGVEVGFDGFEMMRSGAVPVRFRGKIDRVDGSSDGSRVHVIDYKTGARKVVDTNNPLDDGRRLQLGIYAAEIARRHPGAEVEASYWYTEHTDALTGVDCDHQFTENVRQTVSAITGGIEAGVFPLVPGRDQDTGYENCRHCDYDSLCPVDRGEMWSRKSNDSAVEPFRRLSSDR